MAQNLTLHFLTNIAYSNLNRDDFGTPKRVIYGGALRALHSSQSIKRGIRTKYETASRDKSVRSGKLVDEVLRILAELAPDKDKENYRKEAEKRLGKLTMGEDSKKTADTTSESDRSIWFSREELETCAQSLLNGEDESGFIEDGKSGSLAIAAFGRMFANKPEKGTEAAVAVSPGITTHATGIDSDYFTTGDDVKERDRQSGATFLGVSRYVNGTFYRTVSIDKKQLRESWSAIDCAEADANLHAFVRALVYGAPRGKENSTAPYAMPSLILVEEQNYRTAYSFETPVKAGHDGGFEAPSIARLSEQFKQARTFDPGNFGELTLVSGTAALDDESFTGADRVNLAELIDRVVDWIRRD